MDGMMERPPGRMERTYDLDVGRSNAIVETILDAEAIEVIAVSAAASVILRINYPDAPQWVLRRGEIIVSPRLPFARQRVRTISEFPGGAIKRVYLTHPPIMGGMLTLAYYASARMIAQRPVAVAEVLVGGGDLGDQRPPGITIDGGELR